MGWLDKLRGELIDIIQWLDDSRDTMVHRFERHGNEIKYGAKLIVREGQAAVFVNEGQIADVFPPGTYTLETRNLPLLSTLMGWKYGFESPFKAEVYFCSTRQFTDLKWGTKNPVMLRDAEFGPVRLRAFGTYAIRVKDPRALLKDLVGTNAQFSTDGIADQLRNILVSRFTDILGESRIGILDLAASYDELGKFLTSRMAPDLEQYGLELTTLLVENISLPPEVEQALDQRSKMGVIGDLSRYAQYQTAEAMREAARNPAGGTAAGGMGVGMGYAMGAQMAHTLGQTMGGGAAGPSSGPPPVGAAGSGPPPGTTASAPPAHGNLFYVSINDQPVGPLDAASLRLKVQTGEVTGSTLAWTSGMSEWTSAAAIPEIHQMLASAPPPLPPRK